MSSPVDTYFKSIHEKFGFYANWLPNAPRALGDVGVRDGMRFERLTDLGLLKVPFATIAGGVMPDLSHSSGTNVSVKLKAAGEAIPNVGLPLDKAGASISLSGSGAFLFQAAGPKTEQIQDRVTLGRTLAAMLKLQDGSWEEDWSVVVETVTTASLTVVMSASSEAKLELEASGALGPGGVALANVNGGLSVSTSTGSVTKVLAAAAAVPMFKLVKLRRSIVDIILGRGPKLGRGAGLPELPDSPDEWLEGVVV
jgi:hypothetical protein